MSSSNKHRIVKIQDLSKFTYKIICERNQFEFTSGQCVNIGPVGTPINREYSTYSSENDDKLEFLIREIKEGLVSSHLRQLSKGEYICIHGSYGNFCIDQNNLAKKHIFIASGTGIAPFSSFIKTYPQINYEIIHGVAFVEELYEKENYFDSYYYPCISRENNHKYYNGRITEFLKKKYTLSSQHFYYICGNGNMISEVYDILISLGIKTSNIYTESFFQ